MIGGCRSWPTAPPWGGFAGRPGGDRTVKVIRITRPGDGTRDGFEAGAIGAGLLASDKPEPGFLGIGEGNRRRIIIRSGDSAGARHMQRPLKLKADLKKKKNRTNSLYIRY